MLGVVNWVNIMLYFKIDKSVENSDQDTLSWQLSNRMTGIEEGD